MKKFLSIALLSAASMQAVTLDLKTAGTVAGIVAAGELAHWCSKAADKKRSCGTCECPKEALTADAIAFGAGTVGLSLYKGTKVTPVEVAKNIIASALALGVSKACKVKEACNMPLLRGLVGHKEGQEMRATDAVRFSACLIAAKVVVDYATNVVTNVVKSVITKA